MFWGFPQRLRLQRWLIENPAPGAQKGGAGGASGPSMHPESPYFGWEPIFHPNYGQIPCWPKIWSFGGWKTSFGCFEALFELPEPASVGRHNLWGKPQNISERSGWSGGVICRYFTSKNSWENLICLKIEIFTTCLLLPLFLDDPVSSFIYHWSQHIEIRFD